MKTFDFMLVAVLGEMIPRQSDNLSQTFQKRTTSAAEGQVIAKSVIAELRTEFDLFWEKVMKKAESVDVEETLLPRTKDAYDGNSSSHFHHEPPQCIISRRTMKQLIILLAA